MSFEDVLPWLIILAKCAFSVAFVMQIVPLLIWAERKGSAYIQDRPGPNRAHIMGIRAIGLVHTLNDVVKLIMKEDIVPSHVSHRYWAAAPVIAMTVALITFSVVPFGDTFLGYKLKVSDIDGGLLFILAMTSLGVYGVMLAGWGSNNKFSLLGGLRASAQMVSYELSMGLSAAVVFLMSGTVNLSQIVEQQVHTIQISDSFSLALPAWNVFSLPGFIAFVLFWVAAFAETNRTPFDLPEGEAELVAGYHTEYSSLRFALFFMAEYANMIVASAVTATLFFGGYTVPFLSGEIIRSHSDLLLAAVGFGGGLTAFPVFAFLALKRRSNEFYKSIPANDPRQREPLFWAGLWGGAALAHIGLGVLGLTGIVGSTEIGPELVALVFQLTALGVKVLIGCWIIIWVRWTVPRFRYDQLMNLGWRLMLPVALGNVFLAALWQIVKHTLTA